MCQPTHMRIENCVAGRLLLLGFAICEYNYNDYSSSNETQSHFVVQSLVCTALICHMAKSSVSMGEYYDI